MKLVWHIVRKDLRQNWVLITFFLAAYATRLLAGLGILAIDGPDRIVARATGLTMLASLAGVIQWATAFLLVGVAVHHDPLLGTTAFWATRPISGWRLLAAKVLLLGLVLVAAPVFLALPWWIHCGFAPADLGAAIGATASAHGIFLALTLPLAAVSRTTSRYLVVALVSVVALSFLHSFGAGWARVAGASGTGEAPFLLAVVLTGIAVTVQQFAARRLARSVLIAVLGLVGYAAVLVAWPRVSTPGGSAHRDVSLTYASAQLRGNNLEISLAAKAADGLMVTPGFGSMLAAQQWRFPDGMVSRHRLAASATPPASEIAHILVGAPAKDLVAPATSGIQLSGQIADRTAEALRRGGARFWTTLPVMLWRPKRLDLGPVAPNATARDGSLRYRVLATHVNAGRRSATLMQVRRVDGRDRDRPVFMPASAFLPSEEPDLPFLCEAAGEVIAASGNRHSTSTVIGEVRITIHELSYPATATPEAPPHLVVLASQFVDSVNVPVEVSDFDVRTTTAQ